MKVILKNTEVVFQRKPKVKCVGLNGGYITSDTIRLSGNNAILFSFITGDDISTQQEMFMGTSNADCSCIRIQTGNLKGGLYGGEIKTVAAQSLAANKKYYGVLNYGGNKISLYQGETAYDVTLTPGSGSDNAFIVGVKRTAAKTYPFNGKLIGIYIKNDATSGYDEWISDLENNSDVAFVNEGIDVEAKTWTATDGQTVLTFSDTPTLYEVQL